MVSRGALIRVVRQLLPWHCHAKEIGWMVGLGVVVDGSYSNWRLVRSRAPKGSILGPVLFYIFINNLEEETADSSDETKLRGPIPMLEGRAAVQRDLNRMEEQTSSKLVLFGNDNCKVQPWEGEMAGSDAWWGQTGGAAALLKRSWGLC